MSSVEKSGSRFVHVAYGIRRDGCIGQATDSVPVLSHVVFDAHDRAAKAQWHWSDGSVTEDWTYRTQWMPFPAAPKE